MDTLDQDVLTVYPTPKPLPRDHLQTRIDVFDTSIQLTNYQNDTAATRPIDPDTLINALTARRRQVSPILPDNTIWWSHSSYGTAIAVWEPPRIRRVAMQTAPLTPPERLNLPMPGMLFICVPGQPPYVFAAPERPNADDQRLFHAPTFNTFSNGSTCPGSNEYPMDHAAIPESFWRSFFSFAGHSNGRSRKHHNALWQHWQEIHDQPEYPVEDLVPAIIVRDAMQLP